VTPSAQNDTGHPLEIKHTRYASGPNLHCYEHLNYWRKLSTTARMPHYTRNGELDLNDMLGKYLEQGGNVVMIRNVCT
jgi:hypothetical protein